MFFKQAVRFFRTSRFVEAATKNSNKSNLSELRKKTGYTFSNCKKALEQNNNDIQLAEEWLHKQAQILGWSKVSKVENRTTSNGLIGVLLKENIGAMVEVNCETDFVARTDKFKSFVDQVAQTCAQYTSVADFDGDLWKLSFENEALMQLKFENEKPLKDLLALLIGSIGENATIKRAICFKTKNEVQIASYTHPADQRQNITEFGKYATIIAFRTSNSNSVLQKNLCQHILGLNPKKIGNEGVDIPVEDKDSETCLIYQEYLLDPNLKVGEFLKENNIELIDYQRFECGEAQSQEMLMHKVN